MKFSYQARTKDGNIQTGFVEASSREGALTVLQKYGLFVTFLERTKEPAWQKKIGFLSEASKRDIVHFTRQLAIMLKSNIPVVEALESIARQINKAGFQEKILRVTEEVEGGATLSKAMSAYQDVFSGLYVGMVQSGEASGKVPESLDYLADYLERENDFSGKIIGAIVYPAFILLVFVVVMLVMASMVVPQFEEIFASREEELPLITKLIFFFSSFLKNWWWFLIFLFGAGIIALILFSRTKDGREFLDGLMLKIPVLDGFSKKVFLGRIALNLSTLIAGGVAMTQALDICANVVGNDVYKKIMYQTREGVRAGKPMSLVLSSYPEQFPLLFLQMVVVGEKTGRLDESLKNVIIFYQKEVDRLLDSFVKFLEPALIIVLGILVAFVAVGLFVPLFERGLSI